jgi:hypothetical protein
MLKISRLSESDTLFFGGPNCPGGIEDLLQSLLLVDAAFLPEHRHVARHPLTELQHLVDLDFIHPGGIEPAFGFSLLLRPFVPVQVSLQ